MKAGRAITRRAALGWLAGGALAAAGCGRSRGSRLTVYSAGPRGLAEKLCAGYRAATGREVELFVATTGS